MTPGALVRLAESKFLPGDPLEWAMASEPPGDGSYPIDGGSLHVGHVGVVVASCVHRNELYVQLLTPTGLGWIFADYLEVLP